MEGLFGKYITSPIFTFQVGQEKKEVVVHSAPSARLSPALDALMNGQMLEAQLRRVNWSDVNVDTFARLCEFAYLDDYTPLTFQKCFHFSTTSPTSKKNKKSTKKKSSRYLDDEPAPAPESEPEAWPASKDQPAWEDSKDHAFELPLRQRNISEKDLRHVFLGLEYTPSRLAHKLEPKGNEGPTQDFTPVLVGHAELYVLADKYGIESLRQLVLLKLHRTLQSFTIYETDVAGITDFVRFVYQNTPTLEGEIDPLRNLVSCYVVFVLGQIGETEAFKHLLAEGGDFVIDFWNLVWSANRPS